MTYAMNGGGNAADDLSSLTTSERARAYLTAHTKFIVTGVLLLFLSGCKFAGNLAKETLIGVSSHRGWDTFTLKGQLPSNFGFAAYAVYTPNEPDKASCQAATFTMEGTVTRRHSQEYKVPVKDQPQPFSFNIPMSHFKGLCGMKLGRVVMEITARYGPEKWQTTYSDPSLYISSKVHEDTTYIPPSGNLILNSQCNFTFKESTLHFGISKLMSCKGAGALLLSKDLSGKTIDLTITANSVEEPAKKDTWIQFPNGWKPCLPRVGFQRCQTPPLFKTFQMNGQTCTIYPGCTEQ